MAKELLELFVYLRIVRVLTGIKDVYLIERLTSQF